MTRQELKKAIQQTRDDHADVLASLPDRAFSSKQLKLQKKHGTPREFAAGCIQAIGEISVLEAKVAICKYRDEWRAAK